MRVRAFGVAIAATSLALATTATLASAAPTKASKPLTSCVDYNNNHVCDGSDVAVVPLLTAGHGLLDTSKLTPPPAAKAAATVQASKKKAKKPKPTKAAEIGVVLEDVSLRNMQAIIYSTGDITMSGRVSTPGDGFLNVTGQNITVAPGATVSTGDVGLIVEAAGTLTLGDGAKLSTSDSTIRLNAHAVVIGNGVNVTAKGYNSSLGVLSATTMSVGEGVTLQATGSKSNPPGGLRISADADLTFNNATLGGRGIDIHALSSTGRPRHIAISNSKVNNNLGGDDDIDAYSIKVKADPGTPDSGASIVFNHVTFNPANAQIDASPVALIQNVVSHGARH